MLFFPPKGSSATRSLNPPGALPVPAASVGQQLSLLPNLPMPSAPQVPPPPMPTAVEAASPEFIASCVQRTKKGTIITSSRYVAQVFGKEHKHVLRDIRELQAGLLDVQEEEEPELLFAEHFYTDSQNKQRPEVVMTEKGFSLLAMGFTGREALKFKLTFINAFEKLRARAEAATPVVAPIEQLAQLPYYTREQFQRECTKSVAKYVLENAPGGKGTLVKHHRTIMTALVGTTPSKYREQLLAEDDKRRIKSLSGRELLRRFEPAKACAAAVFDDAVRLGISIEIITQSSAVRVLPEAFDSLLSLGIRSADMPEENQ